MRSLSVMDALLQYRNWINYSPGPPFNLYAHTPVSEQQLHEELSRLYEAGFRGLSIFGFYNGLENIPNIAKSIGFEKVVVLLWWPNEELFKLEKTNVANHIKYIDSLLIGNEVIHKGTTDFEGLSREINLLKRQYDIPITTGLHRFDYNVNPQLANLGDYIMINLQTWWVNIRRNPVDGAGWIKAMHEEMRKNPLVPKERVIIVHEASWPSGEHVPDDSFTQQQSQENQVIFYKKLLEYEIPFIWSIACDADYARVKSPPGGYGGLWDEKWQPKLVVDLVKKLYHR